jgi:hypothetical protein
MVRDYVAGASLRDVVTKYSYYKEGVTEIMAEAGVLRRKVRLQLGSDTEMQMLGSFHVGAPWREVGRLGGVSEEPAYKFLRKCGIDTTRSIRWKSDERSEAIAADYKSGVRMQDIAQKHGLKDAGQIYSVLEAVGVTELRRGPNPKRGYASLRDRELFVNYGMRLDDYAKMLRAQGGVCLLCGKVETRLGPTRRLAPLSVDHDHKTGKVRGLLCSNCNHGIGSFRDDPELIERAIAYLEKHGGSRGL